MKNLFFSVPLLLLASSAFAADAIVEDTAVAVDPAFSWSGVYVGVQGGYLWTDVGSDYGDTVGIIVEQLDVDADGWLGGVQVGYNYQFNNWVLGAEGEISATNADGHGDIFDLDGSDAADVEVDLDWVGSITAKAGYAMDRTLLYAKGGVGFTSFRLADIQNGGILNDDAEETLTGWTLGAGIEHAITDRWSVRGEYQFYSFDADMEMDVPGFGVVRTYEDNIDVHAVKIGINYNF